MSLKTREQLLPGEVIEITLSEKVEFELIMQEGEV